MPNSSARCAQLPRAVDKVPFYEALKKLKDFLAGDLKELDDSEIVFTNVKLKNFNDSAIKKEQLLQQQIKDEKMNSEFRLSSDSSEGGKASSSGEGNPPTVTHSPGGGSDGAEALRIDPLTGKKRRGRPPKPRPDGTLPPPKRRMIDGDGKPVPRGTNPIDPLTGKKKRGRPKKCDLPPGYVPNSKKRKAEAQLAAETAALAAASTDLNEKSSNETAANNLSTSSTTMIPPLAMTNNPGNKPTKIVPPLPPFSPNFGSMRGTQNDLNDEKESLDPENVKNVKPYDQTEHQNPGFGSGAPPLSDNDRIQHQHAPQYPPSPCDRDPRPPQDYPHTEPNPILGPEHPDYHLHQSHFPPHQQQQQPPQVHHQHTPPYNSNNSSGYPGVPPSGFQASSGVVNKDDVTTKSITGLESLVDQIPALAENDSGVYSSGAGSHPTTPRSVGPYSPQQHPPSSFHAPNPSSQGGFNHYSSVSSSTSDSGAAAVAAQQQLDQQSTNSFPQQNSANSTPTSSGGNTDFSVNSLVHNSSQQQQQQQQQNNVPSPSSSSVLSSHGQHVSSSPVDHVPTSISHATPALQQSDPFSVTSLASSASAHQYDMATKYGLQSGNPYSGMFPGSAAAASSFGAAAAGGFLGGQHSFGAAGHPMGAAAAMGTMGHMAGMGYYGQYPQGYGGTPPGFGHSPYSHGLHVPNPSYPYPSPYGQSPYSQSPYF